MKRVALLVLVGAMAMGGSAAAQTSGASRLELFLVNPAGEVDGVLLRDGRALFFPTDIGHSIAGAVHLHDSLRLEVRDGQRVLLNERDGSEFVLTAPARGGGPVGVPALARAVARGTITSLMREPGVGVRGFVLASGEQVRVPESLAPRLASLHVGDLIYARGYGNPGRWGTGIAPTWIEDPQGHVLLSR